MTTADLLDDLRATAFAPAAAPSAPRIGAEVELLPAYLETGRMAPIHGTERPGTLPLLRGVATRLGWVEESAPDAPKFHTPGGGLISYEPGGQIEVSAPPRASVGALVHSLREAVLPLHEAARDAGILLREVGVDPVSSLREVPLQLHSERYLLMDEHFATIGPAGARMMRQTASLQVNLDWAGDLALHWSVLNAAAPFLTALFANSPLYAGADTGARSFRGLIWTDLDPLRTGVAPEAVDVDAAARAYLRFALQAPALLLREAHAPALPFAARLERGEATLADWRAHLTTLFPEARPKGYVELRGIDALPVEWYAAPLTLLAGLSHPASLVAAAGLLGPPLPGLLSAAARYGLARREIAATAGALFEIGLEGAAELDWVDPPSLAVAREYFDRFTRRSRSPADDSRHAPTAQRPLLSSPGPLD